ncbi:putative coiled-coil protein SlyX [Bacillus fengqiuensis]|nr:putative coiled-coil protein SlyX [Bacillus fengqiuensis]
MVAWILIVSFLLHGISLLFIVLLYTRFVRLKEMEQTQSAMMKEMEEVISAHIMEMKEQNDEFIQKFEQMKRNQGSARKKESPPPPNLPVFDRVSSPSEQDFLQMMETKTAGRANIQEPFPKQEDPMILPEWDGKEDLTPEQIKKLAISLQKKGLTIEEIAKHLHRGKTEIELLLVFNKNL